MRKVAKVVKYRKYEIVFNNEKYLLKNRTKKRKVSMENGGAKELSDIFEK